ncbi:MAG: DUF2182 domain-containing protein [Candidatus Tectomicrobia bacterium]|nr:DUF2182 domain-containing protein [Candidatus Tectomicrobia bacterium]
MIITGWLVMIVAIVLPTSLPLFEMYARMTRRRTDHAVLVALLIAGYLLIWALFGMVAVFVDGLLHQALDQWLWLKKHDWPIGASLFGVAGLYQFTPLKYHCLDQCRSPTRFLTSYWRGRHDRYYAFQLGVRHGRFSLGCCWSLMLLMFAIGMINLGWLLVFGTVMAVEKNVRWGRRFRAPLGVLLLCCGLAIVLEATVITL